MNNEAPSETVAQEGEWRRNGRPKSHVSSPGPETESSPGPETENIQSLLVWSSPSTKGAGAYQLWENYRESLSPYFRGLVLLRGHNDDDTVANLQIKLGFRSVLWALRELRQIQRNAKCKNVVTSISQSDIIFGLFVRIFFRANWTIYVLGQPYPVIGQTRPLKRFLWKYLWLFAARRADGIVAVSDYIARIISRDLGGREIKTVYPSLTNHGKLVESVKRSPAARLRVGFVGRLSHEKDSFLFCSILGNFTDVDAKIYGDGPLRPQVERILDGVTLVGFRSQTEIYSGLDVIMMTSQSEGLPMVLVEASLTGVVPLVCDVGGCAEAIHPQNRDLLVIPLAERRNITLWRERLLVLQNRDTRAAIVKLQKRWAEQNFDAANNSRALAKLVLQKAND